MVSADDSLAQDNPGRPARKHVRGGVARPPKPGQSLAERLPEVARDWDTAGNGRIGADQVAWRSSLLAAWRCHRCGYRGENTVAGRVQIFLKRGPAYGCRRCSIERRDRPQPGRSLAEVRPDLAAEFHAELNAPWAATDLTSGSDRKMYWHCVANLGHAPYLQSIANRRKSGCPACVNRVVTENNSLLAVSPQIAAQWHPSKNGSVSPGEIVAGSNRRVWWKCARGHEWQAHVSTRVAQQTGCGICCRRQQSGAEVALFAELHELLVPLLGKNSVRRHVRPDRVERKVARCDILIVGPDGSVVVEYDGAYWHRDRMDPDRKKALAIRRAGHSVVRVREAPLGPLDPDDVVVNNGAKAYSAATAVLRRMLERGWLPAGALVAVAGYVAAGELRGTELCAALLDDVDRPDLGNESLAATHPALSEEWDYEANGALTPHQVSACTSAPAWWVCPLGDRYPCAPRERATGRGCSVCSGKRVNARTSLASCRPDLAAEYVPQGGRSADDIGVGSHARVSWRCSTCAHEWRAVLRSRTRSGAGCPACAGKVATASANLAAVHPAVAATWHPTMNGALRPTGVRPKSNKVVWWLCPECSEAYRGAVSDRVAAKHSCCGACARRSRALRKTHELHP
ncbi:zinc-ribbon domain-containing protein [Streptomyces sp. Tue6028]|uniref:zinc-ribbon domain-containing protein n=1 Tax=Streptomyces sp. Tue6028 TaxID=2036037 RepID=UPI003D725346